MYIHLQQVVLPEEFQSLFTVEATETRSKGKDHLLVTKGEKLSVIVSSDPKLPPGKYVVEKEDGTREYKIWAIAGNSFSLIIVLTYCCCSCMHTVGFVDAGIMRKVGQVLFRVPHIR